MRRLAVTFAALALALAAPPALAQSRAPMRGAVLLGIEDGDFDTGLSLRGDLELVQKPLAPGVGFSIVGSIGFSRFSQDGGYADLYDQYSWETSLNVLKFVPAARLTFGRSQTLRPYVDAGLGLYYASVSYSETMTYQLPYYPYTTVTESFEADDSEFSLMMRLAGGIAFQVSPALFLGAEIGITPYFGDYDDSTLSILAAAQFRM